VASECYSYSTRIPLDGRARVGSRTERHLRLRLKRQPRGQPRARLTGRKPGGDQGRPLLLGRGEQSRELEPGRLEPRRQRPRREPDRSPSQSRRGARERRVGNSPRLASMGVRRRSGHSLRSGYSLRSRAPAQMGGREGGAWFPPLMTPNHQPPSRLPRAHHHPTAHLRSAHLRPNRRPPNYHPPNYHRPVHFQPTSHRPPVRPRSPPGRRWMGQHHRARVRRWMTSYEG
jgi:hypothetical protein